MENLFTVDCEELDDLLAVLEEGNIFARFALLPPPENSNPLISFVFIVVYRKKNT